MNCVIYIRIGRAAIAGQITVTVVVAVTITVALYMVALVVILTKFSIQLIWIGNNCIDWIASARMEQQLIIVAIVIKQS